LFLLFFFHLFFSLLSLLLPAFLISQPRKDEGRNPLCSLCFFSPNCLPLLRFLSFFLFFCRPFLSFFFFCFPSFFFLLPRSLEGLIT
jgi:hypothetical protein